MKNNIKIEKFDILETNRSAMKDQKALCLWMTGLSGSGKTTLANALESELYRMGKHTYIIDGDNLRNGLCSDLEFSEHDRKENIRRAAELSRLMVDAGLIVIVSLISPYSLDREFARKLFKPNQFIEIYLSASLNTCEKRDVKGLYKKARDGKLHNFTGIDSPYEAPDEPEIIIDSGELSLGDSIKRIIKFLFNED